MILCPPPGVKRNSKLFRALLHFLAFVTMTASASAQVFKWVDDRGVTHYGERPPVGGRATEVPDRLASPAPRARTTPPAPAANEAKNPAQTPPPLETTDSRPSPTAPENPEDKEKRESAQRQARCNQQRELLTRLKQSPPSYALGKSGERVQVDSSEAIARQEKLVVEHCRG